MKEYWSKVGWQFITWTFVYTDLAHEFWHICNESGKRKISPIVCKSVCDCVLPKTYKSKFKSKYVFNILL